MLENMCRYCLVICEKELTAAQAQIVKISIDQVREMFVDVDLNQDDLPKRICDNCNRHICRAYKFYLQCKETNKKLLSIQSSLIAPKSDLQCCTKKFTNEKTFHQHINENHLTVNYSCKICTKEYRSRKGFLIHRRTHQRHKTCERKCPYCDIEHPWKLPYKRNRCLLANRICNICNQGFTNRRILQKHIAEKHSNENDIACSFCPDIFHRKHKLLHHYQRRHSDKLNVFYCGICCALKTKQVLYSCRLLRDHMITEHSSNNSLNANEELVKFDDLPELNFNDCTTDETLIMVEEFLDEAFQLSANDICGYSIDLEKIFNAPEGGLECDQNDVLSSVECTENGNSMDQIQIDSLYNCPKCLHSFQTQNSLMIHLAHQHKEMVLICNDCGQTFNDKIKLEAHQLDHHTKDTDVIQSEPYPCTICAQMFPNRSEMLKHRIEHKSNGFFCTLCDKHFQSIGGLKYHLKTHTGIKSFSCPFCQRKFTAKSNLNVHLRSMHTNFKTIQCTDCQMRFSTADHLRKHSISVHRQTRNYLCSECGKSYLQKSHLMQHVGTHTGIKPNECDFCTKKYSTKSSLRKHLRIMHLAV